MERPEKVYLSEPIEINGIKVQHTRAGLVYMIDHYTTILAQPLTDQQLKDEHRQYIAKLIDNYTIHLQLYEHERSPKTIAAPVDLPATETNDQREEEVPYVLGALHDNGNGKAGG